VTDDAVGPSLADRYAALSPRLMRVAYGILGTITDAEDVVQEAWVRLQRADASEIRDLEGWLVTVVARLSLDVLGSARVRRETYPGQWLPEPVVTRLDGGDPADRVAFDEEVSMALLVVLETLSPAERTAFVLHDVFGLDFNAVAVAVGRTPEACRQLAWRARRHVRSRAPRYDVDVTRQHDVVVAFLAACDGADLDGLTALLDPDVVLRGDGGGLVPSARQPIVGAHRVAQFLIGVRRAAKGPLGGHVLLVNGAPGALVASGGRVISVMSFAVHDGRVTEVDAVLSPEKLAHVRLPGA
jgi:RNA polymerase sigma-70 factor (ECF subfamily)